MQSSYNIVGFQNHLKFAEQKRIFRMIPGLENAEFLRLGQIHRNTYINAPQTLEATMAREANHGCSSPDSSPAPRATSRTWHRVWSQASMRFGVFAATIRYDHAG